jgi:hypothetical protein
VHIPARCYDIDGTWESTADIVDQAWCRDQTKCGVFVDSQCTNGESGGTLDDCPNCYSFAPSRCENHNAKALDAADQQIPFPIHLSQAATADICEEQDDTCLFEERRCQAASSDHAVQFVSASTAEVCQAFKGGCTWNKAYTYKTLCQYTPPVDEHASTCSDAHNAGARQASAAEDGEAQSAFGVSSTEFVRVSEVPDSYTGSCFDGEQNGDEQGVDCDGTQYGAKCPACPTTTTAAPTTTTAAPEVIVTTTTAAPTEGPVEVSPAGAITTSLFTVVLLALSALFMF